MPNLVALIRYLLTRRFSKILNFFMFCYHGNQSFRWNQILSRNSEDGRTDGRMHDGQQAMTLARWPMASGAKNVFIHNKQVQSVNHIWSLIFYQMTNFTFCPN